MNEYQNTKQSIQEYIENLNPKSFLFLSRDYIPARVQLEEALEMALNFAPQITEEIFSESYIQNLPIRETGFLARACKNLPNLHAQLDQEKIFQFIAIPLNQFIEQKSQFFSMNSLDEVPHENRLSETLRAIPEQHHETLYKHLTPLFTTISEQFKTTRTLGTPPAMLDPDRATSFKKFLGAVAEHPQLHHTIDIDTVINHIEFTITKNSLVAHHELTAAAYHLTSYGNGLEEECRLQLQSWMNHFASKQPGRTHVPT